MLLTNNPYPQDPRVSKEAVTLAAAGYRVSVICPRSGNQPARECLDDVHVYRFRLPGQAKGFVGYVFEHLYATTACFVVSLRVLAERGFDVVHVNNPPDTLGVVAGIYKLVGKRFVFDHRDLAPEMYRARFGEGSNRLVAGVLEVFEKLCCRLTDHVIATNESYKALEMQRGRVPAERITIVRYGPDLRFWSGARPDPEVRAGAETVILWLGIMGFQDGVDYLLRAIHHLVFDLGRRRIRCLIVGYGDALEAMKALATELDLDDCVRFTGPLWGRELVSKASAADICVVPDPSNPYTDRSTLVKIYEYMALAKPIVAFDLPEHRVSAGPAAVYVRPNDERAFAEAIAQLMDDPDRCAALGELGRRRVETDFSWDNSARDLLDAYAAVLGNVPAKSPTATHG